MHDVIDGLKKSYITSIHEILKKWGPASGPGAIAFGFGIMKGSVFEFMVRFICDAPPMTDHWQPATGNWFYGVISHTTPLSKAPPWVAVP